MNKILTVVVFLLMSISTWAGQVIIVKNPTAGGTVTASGAAAGETCTLTVMPTDGYYLKSLKAVTTVDGSAIQAPQRRTDGIDIDETELTITSDATADPSGETTHLFTMPTDENLNVEVTAEFEQRISISTAVITLAETSYTYDGTAKDPAVSSVKLGETTLETNEYSVSYSNNTAVGNSATVTVTGQHQYTGTATTTFTISAKPITSDMITLSASSFVYNEGVQVPTVTVNDGDYSLVGDDYSISYQVLSETGEPSNIEDENTIIDVATYNVVVTGKGNYGGSATKSFAITKAPLTDLSVEIEGWMYGDVIEMPEVSVDGNVGEGGETYYYKVKDADDNTYTTDVPVNAGAYTIKVVVSETANYQSGSATANFTIAKAPLTDLENERELTVSISGWNYGATPSEPSVDGNLGNGAVTYTYKDAEDEEAEFSGNVPTNVGSYLIKATVAETANYLSGEAIAEFTISPAEITEVTLSTTSLPYNGGAQTVTIESVKAGDLVLDGDDYTVSYEKINNDETTTQITQENVKAVGSYNVVVTGKGNFTGTASATFNIINRTLAANEVTFHNNWATYFSEDGDVELPEGEGIGAFVATGVSDGVVTVSQIKNIPEGVAVLLNNATETAGTVAFDPEEDTNMLKHASEDISTSTGNALFYGLYNGEMWRVTGTIPAGKNYIKLLIGMNNEPQAPNLTIVIEGESSTTGVNDVRSKMDDVRGDYFDLQGRKLQQKPSKKGLYIHNGKKVVVNNK